MEPLSQGGEGLGHGGSLHHSVMADSGHYQRGCAWAEVGSDEENETGAKKHQPSVPRA